MSPSLLLVVDHFLADAAVSVVLGTLQQIAVGVVLIVGRITRHIPVAVILGIADVIAIVRALQHTGIRISVAILLHSNG